MDRHTLDRLTGLFPRFGGLSHSELDELLHRTNARLVEDSPRDPIIRKGIPVEEISCLLSGWATRYVVLPDGRRQVLTFKTPGSYICVHALCKPVLPFNVQAVTRTERIAMNIDALIDAIGELRFASQIFHAIGCQDLTDAEDEMISLGRRDATEKISRLIVKLYVRLSATGLAENSSFAFPIRQTHIADATGLTPVHVNRTLRQLRDNRVITLVKGKIEIHDLDTLLKFGDMTRDELNNYPMLPRGWERLSGKNAGPAPEPQDRSPSGGAPDPVQG
jgi:CRP-like cAMP-binding protein